MRIVSLWLALFLSIIAGLYCLLAVLMAGSLSGSPNYSKERLEYNLSVWVPGTFLSLAAAIVFGILIILSYKRRKGPDISTGVEGDHKSRKNDL